MSDNDSGYRSAYQYRPNTDPPSHPGDRQQWSEARDGERLRSSMKAHGELMNSLQNGSGGDGSGKWIVVAAFLLFTVCACFVAIAKEMTRLPVPTPVAIVGLWLAYVASGTLAGGSVLAAVERLSPPPGRLSRRRRRWVLFSGMLTCAVVTWLMEAVLTGIGTMARTILANAPTGELLKPVASNLGGLLIEQAPGCALLVFILAIGLGPKYRGPSGLLKCSIVGSFAVICALVVILTCGILRAS